MLRMLKPPIAKPPMIHSAQQTAFAQGQESSKQLECAVKTSMSSSLTDCRVPVTVLLRVFQLASTAAKLERRTADAPCTGYDCTRPP